MNYKTYLKRFSQQSSNKQINIQNLKVCHKCQEIFFSHQFQSYQIKFSFGKFDLENIEKIPSNCPNSKDHNYSSEIKQNTLKQVILNKYLKQYQEWQIKQLNASQQIEKDKCNENQYPLLLIGNNDHSKNYLISQLCQLSDQRKIKNQNQYITKYSFNESQFTFYNTQNYDSNSDTQITEFSKFFASQPIKFIFYVFQYERLDAIKATLIKLMQQFISINKKQQGIIIINKEECYSYEKQNETVSRFQKFIPNITIIYKDDKQEQILEKIKNCLPLDKFDNISFENTIFAQETQQDRQNGQKIQKQFKTLSQSVAQNKINDLKLQQKQCKEEKEQNQQLLLQLYNQLKVIQIQISTAEKTQSQLDDIQFQIEQELHLQENYLYSQKESFQNDSQSQIFEQT